MRHDIPQIGMTYQILNRDGVYDLKKIAQEYYQQQTYLDESDKWSHDRYLKESSNARAQVKTPSARSFKECSIGSINH